MNQIKTFMEKKIRNVSYAVVYLNKYLSLFRKNFKVDSDTKNRSMKYFYAQKAISTSFGLQNRTSLKQNSKKRYSVLKTFLSKPEIAYSNNKTKIIVSIYNKKSMFLLKNVKNISCLYILSVQGLEAVAISGCFLKIHIRQ